MSPNRPAAHSASTQLALRSLAATAALVDYKLVPKHLTPGWEEVLTARSITVTSGVLALGLGVGALLARSRLTASAEQQP